MENYFNRRTSDVELKEICKKLHIQLHGVFMKDELPKTLKNGNYIMNLDSSTGSGTHWVCFHKKGNELAYFDSFGTEPPQEAYEIMTKGKKTMAYYSDKVVQDTKSNICGFYCILFLLHFKLTDGSVHDSFVKFHNIFYDNAKSINDRMGQRNDDTVVKILSKFFYWLS